MFKCPIRKVLLKMSQMQKNGRKGKLYNYHFDHVLSFGDKFWLPTNPICLDTVCHGDELPILFSPNLTSIHGVYSTEEKVLTSEMQAYWGQFARNGVPGASGGIEWPEVEALEEAAMKFSTTEEGVTHHQYTEKCKFWDALGYDWILK